MGGRDTWKIHELFKDRNTERKEDLPWVIAMCKPEAFNHSSRLPKGVQKLGRLVVTGQKLIEKISKIAVLDTRIRQ